MKSSSQDSDSSSKREECIYLGEDGRMHNAYIDQFKIIDSFSLDLTPKPPKLEEGTDINGNWFARATMEFKVAQPINPMFFGIDLASDGSLSSISQITPNNEDRTSEIMDF